VYFDDDALGPSSINNFAELITSTFDNSLDTITYLEFDYNFKQENGSVLDSFIVDIYDGSQWQRVFSRGNDDCGRWVNPICQIGWPHAIIDITAYKNSQCQIRFRYHDGNDWGWYVGIDNIEVYRPLSDDLEIISIDSLRSGCAVGTGNHLAMTIKNNGYLSQSNFQLGYTNNGSPHVIETVNTSLAPDSTMAYVFNTPLSAVIGNNNIVAFTDLSSDLDRSNDTASLQISRTAIQNIPFSDDFESPSNLWQAYGQNSSLQRGIPSGNLINSAASGQNAFVTNLNGNYNASETSYLESPCFDLSSISNPLIISFSLNYQIEINIDKLQIEYTLDGGNNYSKINAHPNYAFQNWHSSQNLFWTGSSNGNWIRMTTLLDNLGQASDISFRFVFQSDGSSQFEGVAIDDFQLLEVSDKDLSIDQITYPLSNGQCGLANADVFIDLGNRGNDTIKSANLYYQVNGGNIIIDSLRTPIAPGAKKTYQFSQSYNFSNLSSANIKSWIDVVSDTLMQNDTTSKLIQNSQSTNFSLPFSEDFDAYNNWSFFYLNKNWVRDSTPSSNNIYWRTSSNSSSSAGSGPERDATETNYAYLDTRHTSSDASFISPCIDLGLSTQPYISFRYHKYGSGMGPLFLDILDMNQWLTVDSIIGQTHFSHYDPYLLRRVDLSRFSGRVIKFRFRGNRGPTNTHTSNMAIDDIHVFDLASSPLIATKLNVDSSTCAENESAFLRFKLDKFLLDSIDKDSIVFSVYLDNAFQFSEIQSFNLNRNFIDTTIELTQGVPIPQYGKHQIELRVTLTRNGRSYIDTSSIEIQNKIDSLPYFNGFENNFSRCLQNVSFLETPRMLENNGWSVQPDSAVFWAVSDTNFCYYSNTTVALIGTGPPQPGPIEGSAFIHWFKRDQDTSFLYTPCFDLSTYNQAEIEFYYHRWYGRPALPLVFGSFYLEVKSGNQWVEIFRNDSIDNGPISPNWKKATVDISQYLGSDMQFRFINYHSQFENWTVNTSIDAFKIYDPLSTDIQTLKTQTQTLAVYPNPNNGEFNIEVPEELIGERYEIIDISGKVLKNATFRRQSEQIQIEADKGVYILRVPGTGINQKVVVY